MEQNSSIAAAAATAETAAAKSLSPANQLKNLFGNNAMKSMFANALGNHSGAFISSVIDLVNADSALQKCDMKAVAMEALKAATLHLPVNKALGFAYIIPYQNTKKDGHGQWHKVMEPTFQIGYKGLIQLALRTGQYRTINAGVVYEGELQGEDKLTGRIDLGGERLSDGVTGYFAYIELVNGFSKTLYMSVDDMARHAKRYAPVFKTNKTTSIGDIAKLAQLPPSEYSTVGWKGNFESMAIKTILRILLSKYGYLSTDMQGVIAEEQKEEYDTSSFAEARVVETRQQQLADTAAKAVEASSPATPGMAPDSPVPDEEKTESDGKQKKSLL